MCPLSLLSHLSLIPYVFGLQPHQLSLSSQSPRAPSKLRTLYPIPYCQALAFDQLIPALLYTSAPCPFLGDTIQRL